MTDVQVQTGPGSGQGTTNAVLTVDSVSKSFRRGPWSRKRTAVLTVTIWRLSHDLHTHR